MVLWLSCPFALQMAAAERERRKALLQRQQEKDYNARVDKKVRNPRRLLLISLPWCPCRASGRFSSWVGVLHFHSRGCEVRATAEGALFLYTLFSLHACLLLCVGVPQVRERAAVHGVARWQEQVYERRVSHGAVPLQEAVGTCRSHSNDCHVLCRWPLVPASLCCCAG